MAALATSSMCYFPKESNISFRNLVLSELGERKSADGPKVTRLWERSPSSLKSGFSEESHADELCSGGSRVRAWKMSNILDIFLIL